MNGAWSRRVTIAAGDTGVSLGVHVLDSWHGRTGTPELTLLCVHGNPTWAYLWRRLLEQAPDRWRVIAVDQVGMGYSDRTAAPRRLADRVADLARITDELGVTGPVVTVAHDWGGPVSLGWALAHRAQLRGVVLTNTAVCQPPGSPAPTLIRAARSPGLLPLGTVRTSAFVRGALALGPRLDADTRRQFLAPYRTAQRRQAIGDFVADIPLNAEHPSAATLAAIAEGVRSLDVPVLLVWGARDPVFGDVHLRDLIERMPHADVHRHPDASHLVTEHVPESITDILRWCESLESEPATEPTTEPTPYVGPGMLSGLTARRDDPSIAVAQPGRNGSVQRTSWRELAARVDALAGGLADAGVQRGDRVGLLVPPSADLLTCVYACWRIGAVVLAADAGLGVRGMARALRSAAPDHLIAVPRGIALARATGVRVPGLVVGVGRGLGATTTLADLEQRGGSVPDGPEARDEAVVVFTSGATGPAKGVVYRHGALMAQRDALRDLYDITATDALVAAFGPWAVLGPALGIATAVPDVDPRASHSLTAAALADAAAAVSATLVWASPAAVSSVVASATELTSTQREALGGIRLLLSAGAPVSVALLESALAVMPQAQAHTPYGMTEVLPVADISLDELRVLRGRGVCVGRPVAGVTVTISGTSEAEVTGEVIVGARHLKDRYDRLWATQARSVPEEGDPALRWHRSGDVGHLDADGRLWIEGRVAHLITTPTGPVTPVPIEQAVEALPWVKSAAAVGVGPVDCQQVVVIVVPADEVRGTVTLPERTQQVRQVTASVAPSVAAVLVRDSLPVDKRHSAKIDRTALALWAEQVLAGSRP